MSQQPVSVSIIVPVYNTETYLQECLESIQRQGFTNFEVLCVDDGSTDGSVRVLEEFCARDSRFRIVPQRAGGKGPGTARNTALEQARGDYIGFVDSDDVIHDGMIDQLHAAATRSDADIAMCIISKFSENIAKETYAACTYERFIPTSLDKQVFHWSDIRDVLFDLRFVAWNKLYKADFLHKHEIRFSEGIFFEDLTFFYQAMLQAERLRFVRKALYSNRKERDGATTFVQGGRVFDAITAMTQLEQFLTTQPEYTVLHERFEAFRFRKLYSYLYKNDSVHLPPFYQQLKVYAGSQTLATNPYLRETEMRKRELIEQYDLLDFLAHELWEARNKIASLTRQKRRLQQILKPWLVTKRKAKGALRRLRLVD